MMHNATALLALAAAILWVAAMGCAPEANAMTMHKFPNARNLPEVVGQDRYHIARLSERLDGIIRRGVVTRVRPTGAGFEYNFPAGVDEVYLVDVEIYNPGARPIELQGIESALPVRPGHGVRVLIPGGDVTRGPIVIGRLTPAESDVVTFSRTGRDAATEGIYPAIGWHRAWIADIRVTTVQVETSLQSPPNNPVLYYPEAISWKPDLVIEIPTPDGEMYEMRLPVEATLYMIHAGGSVTYVGDIQDQQIIEIDEVARLSTRDLTRDMPVDNRQMTIDVSVAGVLRQASYQGNETLERVLPGFRGSTYGRARVTLSELGVGTK